MPRLRNSNDFVHMEFFPIERKDAFHKQKNVYIDFFYSCYIICKFYLGTPLILFLLVIF